MSVANPHRPPMSPEQTLKAVDRTLKAAKCLIDSEYHGQGIARSYYGVHLLVTLLLRLSSTSPQGMASASSKRLIHSSIPDCVSDLYGAFPSTASARLNSLDAERLADELYNQRIVADYYGYGDPGAPIAKRLHSRATDICLDLTDEVKRITTRKPVI